MLLFSIQLFLFIGAVAIAIAQRNNILGFLGVTTVIWMLIGLVFVVSGGGLGAVLAFATLGPVVTPVILYWLAGEFPVIVIPVFIISAAASLYYLKKAQLLQAMSLSAFLGHWIFLATAWISAELIVGGVIRVAASATADGGYCLTQRSAINMFFDGMGEGYSSPHAALVDGDTTYIWTFHQNAFVPQTNPNFIRFKNETECL